MTRIYLSGSSYLCLDQDNGCSYFGLVLATSLDSSKLAP